MTTEEAIRQRFTQARQESDRLFGQFIQSLSDADASDFEKRFKLDVFRSAEEKVTELRTVLHYLLVAEAIRKEVELETNLQE